MVEADDNAFVSPFPRLSSLLLVFEDSQTGSPPLSAARGRNLADSRRVRGGDGTLLSGNLYRIHSPATDTLNPFARRGGVALPRLARNCFLLWPLIRRGPVPSCKASWFRSIEHANAPQFVPDVPVGASMTPSSPFPRFYIFLLRLYHMFEQRVDLKLKLERERERRWRNFLSLKKRSNLSTVPVTSVPEREIRNFIWIISFHGYSTGMEAAARDDIENKLLTKRLFYTIRRINYPRIC